MFLRTSILSLVISLGGSLLGAADQSEFQFLYLDHQPPVLFNVKIQLDGMSLDDARHKMYESYFQSLDKNDDDQLTGNETKAIPTSRQLQRFGVRSYNAAQNRNSNTPKEPVTQEQFIAYMQKLRGKAFQYTPTLTQQRSFARGGGGFGVPVGMGGFNNFASADQTLFQLLDQNQDKKLTAAEFTFSKALQKKDLDDDECITALELSGSNNYRGRRPNQSGAGNRSASSLLIEMDPNSNYLPVVTQILMRYRLAEQGSETKNTLTAEEWSTSKAEFQKLDANEDELLDIDELTAWLKALKPTFEIYLRYGNKAKGKSTLEVKPLTASGVTVTGSGAVTTIDLEGTRLHLPMPGRMQNSTLSSYVRYFQNYDRDKNGYLDEKEVQRISFIRNAFAAIDRDSDEKIYKEEYTSYFETLAKINSGNISLTVANQGRQFFTMLDQNRDSRLSQRELINIKNLISNWDTNNDQALTLKEIPQQWQLSFARAGTRPVQTRYTVFNQQGRTRQPNRPTRGPIWFQKMDRNKDGDVSQREFLGPLADFKKYDRNNDGLIGLDEAGSN